MNKSQTLYVIPVKTGIQGSQSFDFPISKKSGIRDSRCLGNDNRELVSLRIIALDGSRAFLKRRTGIEEYAYQVIKHLRDELVSDKVILYIRADQQVDFELPKNWQIKKLWAPRLWTHLRLSCEMLTHRPESLFVPAHTIPLIHPKRSVVVIHGLEYEFCPNAYSRWSAFMMRLTIRFSCHVAKTIICVSKNTKKDVMRLYGTAEEKIDVVYEGYEKNERKISPRSSLPYILFIGRLEERKNIVRLIEAFEIVKKKYHLPHRLILVGKSGYKYEKIRSRIDESLWKKDIKEYGYASEEEKWELLKNAEIFFFATLYEGFGIPVLEAQSVGTPVITSCISSLPEVAGDGAILVHPESVDEIAGAISALISNKSLKSDIIEKGLKNVKRFSWEKCAREIAVLLKKKK